MAASLYGKQGSGAHSATQSWTEAPTRELALDRGVVVVDRVRCLALLGPDGALAAVGPTHRVSQEDELLRELFRQGRGLATGGLTADRFHVASTHTSCQGPMEAVLVRMVRLMNLVTFDI